MTPREVEKFRVPVRAALRARVCQPRYGTKNLQLLRYTDIDHLKKKLECDESSYKIFLNSVKYSLETSTAIKTSGIHNANETYYGMIFGAMVRRLSFVRSPIFTSP